MLFLRKLAKNRKKSWCSFCFDKIDQFYRYFFFATSRSSHQRCSTEIGVLKNFTKFTGKHLRQNLFLNKVAGLKGSLYTAYRKSGTQDPERTQDPRRTQDPVRTQDPRRTQGPLRTQDLWRPRTLWGPITLGGPRTLWGRRTLGGDRTLWWPKTLWWPRTLWGPRTLGGRRTLWEPRTP